MLLRKWEELQASQLEAPSLHEVATREDLKPFMPTTTTSKMMYDTRNSYKQSLRQAVTNLTSQLMRRVPVDVKTEESTFVDESSGIMLEDPEVQLHSEVPQHSTFYYHAGKPDRVKKVLRFQREEEDKIIIGVQKMISEHPSVTKQ